MTDAPTALLAAEGVRRSFGERVALEPTDLTLHAGDVLALVGPNGAGKSTLLAILAGALEASGGRVAQARAGTRVGWAPQRPALYGRLSARENLELFARLERLPAPAARATELLVQLGLDDDRRPASKLSGGTVQRLNLGIALLAHPDVLLLDEPTAALDPVQRDRLWGVVRALCARGGAAAFATQNLEEVDAVANRVVALDGGRVVYGGPPEGFAGLRLRPVAEDA